MQIYHLATGIDCAYLVVGCYKPQANIVALDHIVKAICECLDNTHPFLIDMLPRQVILAWQRLDYKPPFYSYKAIVQ